MVNPFATESFNSYDEEGFEFDLTLELLIEYQTWNRFTHVLLNIH